MGRCTKAWAEELTATERTHGSAPDCLRERVSAARVRGTQEPVRALAHAARTARLRQHLQPLGRCLSCTMRYAFSDSPSAYSRAMRLTPAERAEC
eukprot:15457243-Alexandrium_andersonii.AAC.1